MSQFQTKIENVQRAFCVERGASYMAVGLDSKLGLALSTAGRIPTNGLRHPISGDTCGWYIWWGEEFSNASDFFSPVHTVHVYEKYPEIVKVLGLPPGYRFLMTGDYLDVWYDPSLLDV